MVDMSNTIIAKSDQLNSDDLIGRSITIKITNVTAVPGDQPIGIFYEGDDGKPWKPCKSMRRVLVHVWGVDGKEYIGRSLTLYRDPEVKFGGIAVGGIRISHMSHLAAPMQIALTERRGSKKPYVVKPLVEKKAAERTPEVDVDEIKRQAEEHAAIGLTSLREWFDGLIPVEKVAIKPFMEEFKKTAALVDEKLPTEISP